MNREIKFRAWNSKTKEFECFELHNITVPDRLLCQHDYPVQQFTGLKDKNGKEIYEGDVINFAYTHDNTFTGDVKWFDDRGAFGVVTGNAFELLEGLLDYWEYVEVIGNIFENKDLICDHTKYHISVNGNCYNCGKSIFPKKTK